MIWVGLFRGFFMVTNEAPARRIYKGVRAWQQPGEGQIPETRARRPPQTGLNRAPK